MLRITGLFAVLLLALASPALADSIPLPVTSFSTTGTNVVGFFTSPTVYELSGTNVSEETFRCIGVCLYFEVEDGVTSGRSTTNYAELFNFAGEGSLFGHLGKVTLNTASDNLTAVFYGKENLLSASNIWAWYTVKGTFSDNLATGNGNVNLTSTTYIGTSPVPEPETLVTLVTGICSIAGLVVRKMRSI